MAEQMSFFSDAITHLQNAFNSLVDLDFERANAELTIAREIDPFISNLDSTAKLIHFFEKQFLQYESVPTFLAKTWQRIPQAHREKELFVGEARLADEYVVKIAEKQLNPNKTFIDSEETLHWGCCYLIAKKYEKAFKVLLNSLTSTHPLRTDLWGYYGDACIACKRYNEAESAYLRALAIDPQQLDFFRLKNKDIIRLYSRLEKKYPKPEARALLLFHAWLENLFKIPKYFGGFIEQNETLKKALSQSIPNDKATRLHYFSICLCYDQAQSDGQINYQVRERMMELDKELFGRYLEKLE